MPDLDGFEVTRELRARPATRDIPIIAVTADAFNEAREKSLAAGCNAHLTKPLELPRLFEVLESLLPLEWKYADPVLPSGQLDDKKLPFDKARHFMEILKRGDVMEMRAFVGEMKKNACCPAMTYKINELLENFKLSELKRLVGQAIVESNSDQPEN